MRSEAEMMHLIMDVALKLGVKAIAMNGSKANQQAPADEFQDYDIVYFVDLKQMHQLIDSREWLTAFGKQLIMQVPGDFEPEQITYQDFFTFLMLFADGNRIDLGLCPVNKVQAWQKNDPVGKVIYDPDNLLPTDLLADSRIYYQTKPTELGFSNCCNEFWWVSTYVVKGIARQELLYGTDHFYQNCFQEFLQMLSFRVAAESDYQIDLGKNHKYLFKYLTTEEATSLQKLLNLSDYQKLTENLFQMQTWFEQLATDFATKNNYRYDTVTSARVMEYSRRKLGY